MSDKPKKNMCRLDFKCSKNPCNLCVYYGKKYCASSGSITTKTCKSLVAQTNAMVLALQDMGFDVTLKAKEKEA